ncbi:MAG TPA: sulfite exporter TauE/SafE family protein [Flavobacteriales bacterium]|nr:sulfite exporter TauE/SafE family protein [Flavobacteriales bacterium]
MNEATLALLLALVAFLYASVGHGGASGYIAVMTLLGFAPEEVRPKALLLNLFVSAMAFAQFSRAGHFRWKLFWPFAVASVPMAWIGARIQLDVLVYKRVLALCLVFAVARLLGVFGRGDGPDRSPAWPVALGIGALLGLVSGMIGIGGGILLSPVLLLFRWSTAKESAAVSAAFIFVNSLAGLISLGASSGSGLFDRDHVVWVGAALLGGSLGAYIGAQRFSQLRLRQVLGVVLLFASIKLFFA